MSRRGEARSVMDDSGRRKSGQTGEFRQRFPWIGGDLQTVRNYLIRPPASIGNGTTQRIELPAGDETGDRFVLALDTPQQPDPGRPLVVVIHGLTGCQDSFYVLNTARFWLGRGHAVLRVNLRAAGPSRQLCREQYHAGRSRDIAAVLAGLPYELTRSGVIAIGYSLGGNVLLKYLGEEGGRALVRFAASVSAPIDLAASARRFQRARNWFYQRWLLSRMKAEATTPSAAISGEERLAIIGSRSVWEFDNRYVAPRNGFDGAEDYYARCSAIGFLGGIKVTTLLIHARDDPWIPPAPYEAAERLGNRHLVHRLTDRGGHVGFHGRGSRTPWHDRLIAVEADSEMWSGS
jgi:predicted alpha/beta-fold hydrolase